MVNWYVQSFRCILHGGVHFSTADSAHTHTLPRSHFPISPSYPSFSSSLPALLPPGTLNWIRAASSNLAAKLCFTAGQFHPRSSLSLSLSLSSARLRRDLNRAHNGGRRQTHFKFKVENTTRRSRPLMEPPRIYHPIFIPTRAEVQVR